MSKLLKCPLCGSGCRLVRKHPTALFAEDMVHCKQCPYHADLETHRGFCAKLTKQKPAKRGRMLWTGEIHRCLDGTWAGVRFAADSPQRVEIRAVPGGAP